MRVRDLLYGNAPAEFAVAGTIAFAVLALVWIIRAVVRRRLRNAHLTATDIDDFLLDAANRTKLLLLVLPAIHLGARVLTFPPRAEHILSRAAEISLVAQVALWAAGVIEFWLGRYSRSRLETDPAAATTIQVFRVAMIGAIWVMAAIATIANLGFKVTPLLTGLGIGGIAVALATQNILADLFASLSIVIDKPFVVGESISVDSYAGTVEQIGLKTTRLRSVDGEELIISNGDLLKSRIRNFRRMTSRRVLLRFGVPYETSPDVATKIPQMIRAIVERQPHARFERAHLVTLGESALRYEAAYYIDSPEQALFFDTQHAVNLEVMSAFEAEQIVFAPAVTAARSEK